MAMKGQNTGQYTVPIVCFLIILMDVIAGILGIQAEIAQNKVCSSRALIFALAFLSECPCRHRRVLSLLVQNLRVWIFECRDPSYKAFTLGFAAAVLLAFAHAIANLVGGCHFVWSKEELDRVSYNKQLAVASLIFSWITLVTGFAMLIAGVMANSSSRKSCGISHHRYLSIGGIACIIHATFAVSYYVSATAVDREEKKLNPPGLVHQPTPQAPA